MPRLGFLFVSAVIAVATIMCLCFEPQRESRKIVPAAQGTGTFSFSGSSTLTPVNQNNFETADYWKDYRTTYSPMYDSAYGEEDPLDIQCPIPPECRVPNYTGIQCVWSSLEMLGRWAEEPKLINPPLTSRHDCKSYSSPSLVRERLTQLGVKFEQSYQNRAESLALLKRAMAEHRGCLWGVPGHAMVLVHYDEEKDVVKWVDNSDRSLKVQTTTIAGFNRRWDTWICVIYADKDIISTKVGSDGARLIKIIDRNNPQGNYPKDYIPLPNGR